MILRQLLHYPSLIFKPQLLASILSPNYFSTKFPITKTTKKFRKKQKEKPSSRTQPKLIPYFENIFLRDAHFRFLTRTKDYLSKQPLQVIRLGDAATLHQKLGFPRGQKIAMYLHKHPLIFHVYRHTDNTTWLGFSDLMNELLEEERAIMERTENDRLNVIRKLLMMSVNETIALSKLYNSRLLFGLPENLSGWVLNYPEYFKVVVEEDGKRILHLVKWDTSLAVSALEKKFMVDENKAKRAFKFDRDALELDMDDDVHPNLVNTLPLVSPYSDGSKLEPGTLKSGKHRLGVIHEFLSLTLEKRAYVHNVMEFKDEFNLTKHTYQMLLKQRGTFYLARTETIWCVFLRDAYGKDGVLLNKDPQVVFTEKLYEYANKQQQITQSGCNDDTGTGLDLSYDSQD